MNTITVINKDTSELVNSSDKVLTKLALKHLKYNRFRVGSEYRREDYLQIKKLKNILCNSKCLDKEFVVKVKEKLNLINLKYV